MTDEAVAPTPPPAPPVSAEPPIGPGAAVVGAFASPSETFRRLVAKPTWWLPLVLMLVVTAISVFVASPKIDLDRTVRDAIEKRVEKTGRQVPPQMIERQVEISKKFAKVVIGGIVVLATVVFFVAGLILWGAARIMGADARYGQLLAIWAHATLPNLVIALLGIPIFFPVPDESLTQVQAQQLVKSNLGAFLPETASAPLRAFGSSIDPFAIWALVLLVIGFRRLPGLSKGAATAIPIVLWVLWVLGKVGWAAAFG